MSELRVVVPLARIGRAGTEHVVEADAAMRAAVARRLQIPAVPALACRFLLHRHGECVEATGRLQAVVVQDCVVSLEPFEAAIDESFRLRFVPPGEETQDQDDPLSVDELPIEAGAIDLGEAAVQQLALALDPYPRRPDAVLPASAEPAGTAAPFAALVRLPTARDGGT